MKAAYTLLDRPEVTPEHLQAGHQSLVKARLQMPGTSLLLEDTIELGWTRVHPVKDLASSGNLQSNRCRGFRLHMTLAVRRLCNAGDDRPNAGRPAVETLGIADQECVLKKPRLTGGRPGDVRASQKLAVGCSDEHVNRKGDGLPGWQTLWRGLTRLATLVEGYRFGQGRFGERQGSCSGSRFPFSICENLRIVLPPPMELLPEGCP